MWTYIIAFLLFCLALLAMAIGVMLRGDCIKGSCGGLAHIPGLKSSCAGCEKSARQGNEKGSTQ